MQKLTRYHFFLLSSSYNYSPLFVAQGVLQLKKRKVLKGTCKFLMLTAPLVYQRQVCLQGAASLVQDASFGDVS